MTLITRHETIDWGITGQVGVLGVTVKANAAAGGATLIARATSGIVEIALGQYLLSVPGWDEAWGAALYLDDGTRSASQWLDPLPADAVWDELLAGHAVAGSAGKALTDASTAGGLTAAGIADAVHDEQLSGHTTTGSAGKALADAGGTAVDRQITVTARGITVNDD